MIRIDCFLVNVCVYAGIQTYANTQYTLIDQKFIHAKKKYYRKQKNNSQNTINTKPKFRLTHTHKR